MKYFTSILGLLLCTVTAFAQYSPSTDFIRLKSGTGFVIISATGTKVVAPGFQGDGASLTGLTKAQVGLPLADNTPDTTKPVSTAQAAAIATAQAYAANRANGTGTQLASTISDFTTAARAAFSAGTGLSITSGVIGLSSLNISQFTNDSGYMLAGSGTGTNLTLAGTTTVSGTLIASLYMRSGTYGAISGTVLGIGEGGWAKDTNELFVGDGATPGGVKASPPTTHGINAEQRTSSVNGDYNVVGQQYVISGSSWNAGTKTLSTTTTPTGITAGSTIMICPSIFVFAGGAFTSTTPYYAPIIDTVASVSGTNITLTNTSSLSLINDSASDFIRVSGTNAPDFAAGANSQMALGLMNFAYGGGAVAMGYANRATSASGVAIGTGCVASGLGSVSIGYNNISSGIGTIAIGYNSNASGEGKLAYAVSTVPRTTGTTHGQIAQRCFYQVVGQTTDGSSHEITSPERLAIDTNSTAYVNASIVARDASGNSASFERRITAKRTSGVTSLVGSVQTIGTDQADAGAASFAVTVAAGGLSNQGVKCTVTGTAGVTVNWICNYDYVEVQN